MKPDKICDENFSIGKYFDNVINIVKRKLNTILFNENQFIVSDFPNKSNTAKIELNLEYLESLLGSDKNLQQITDIGNTTTNNINVKNINIGDVQNVGGQITSGIDIIDSEDKKMLINAYDIYKFNKDDIGNHTSFRIDTQNNLSLEKYDSVTQEQLISIFQANKKISIKTDELTTKFISLLDPIANNITHTTEKTIPISVNGQFANAEGDITIFQNSNRQVLYVTGTITQTGNNAPIVTITSEDINDAALTFTTLYGSTGLYLITIASTLINLGNYKIEVFIQDKAFGSLEEAITDDTKFEFVGDTITLLSLRNGILTDGITANQFSIHLYKK